MKSRVELEERPRSTLSMGSSERLYLSAKRLTRVPKDGCCCNKDFHAANDVALRVEGEYVDRI